MQQPSLLRVDQGEPKLSQPLGDEYIAPLPGPRIVTLPSPYALAQGTGVEPKTIAEDVLKPQLDSLDAELVVLEEPFLAREENADLEPLDEALQKLQGGPALALWLTFGDATDLLKQGLDELPVAAVGIDFYATKVTDVPQGFGNELTFLRTFWEALNASGTGVFLHTQVIPQFVNFFSFILPDYIEATYGVGSAAA